MENKRLKVAVLGCGSVGSLIEMCGKALAAAPEGCVVTDVGSTKQDGLDVKLKGLKPPEEKPESGGSDDIGDISWIMPTITTTEMNDGA